MKSRLSLACAHIALIVGALLAALWLSFASARPARASGSVTITDCSTGQGLADAMNDVNNHAINFNCGPNPVVITLTQAGGYYAIGGTYYTIDGGNKVALTGAGNNRLFDVMANASLTLTNIILENGAAGSGGDLPGQGGAILAEGDMLMLNHVTITGSQSAEAGGALAVTAGTAIVQDSLIERNLSPYGGGIYNLGTLSLLHTIVISNQAVFFSGGGLYLSGTVVISNSQILSNSAQGNSISSGGGGLAITSVGQVSITGSQINDNHTSLDTYGTGGGILDLGTLTVTLSSLNRNQALGGGGVEVGLTAATATLSNVSLMGNLADDGAGMSSAGTANLTNVTFTGNQAAQQGGGLFAATDSINSLSDSTLAGNMADLGGGIYINTGGAVALFNTSLSANTAASGAGLYINQGAADLRSATRLIANIASVRGGGIYSLQGDMGLTNVSVQANMATLDGAGIFNDSGTANLTDVTLSGNAARYVGGGLYNTGGSTATLRSVTLSGNTSGLDGGGLANLGKADLTNVTVSGNTAQVSGGGIFNAHLLTLRNVTLSNNAAPTGGALYMLSPAASTALTNTILAYSSAGGNCAGSFTSEIYTLSSDNSCLLVGVINGHDSNGLDPLLTALGNYGGLTLVDMLKLGSPAIAGMLGNDAPGSDQRGQPRPGSDGNYDLGAVERQPADSDLAPRLYLPLVRR